jgi:hypothetical protein
MIWELWPRDDGCGCGVVKNGHNLAEPLLTQTDFTVSPRRGPVRAATGQPF